jgi:hypothetical protein
VTLVVVDVDTLHHSPKGLDHRHTGVTISSQVTPPRASAVYRASQQTISGEAPPMRHILAAAAVLALAACSALGPQAEVTGPPLAYTPQASTAALAQTMTATTQSSPEGRDPGCDMPQLADVLYGTEQAFKQGAFDLKGTAQLDRAEAGTWWLSLSRVEDTAGLDVYKATVKAKDSLKSYLDSPEGSTYARVMAYAVRGTMADLARRCGIDAAYTFADA